jgi:hypothetical protein
MYAKLNVLEDVAGAKQQYTNMWLAHMFVIRITCVDDENRSKITYKMKIRVQFGALSPMN